MVCGIGLRVSQASRFRCHDPFLPEPLPLSFVLFVLWVEPIAGDALAVLDNGDTWP